jgi:hypothetical protein
VPLLVYVWPYLVTVTRRQYGQDPAKTTPSQGFTGLLPSDPRRQPHHGSSCVTNPSPSWRRSLSRSIRTSRPCVMFLHGLVWLPFLLDLFLRQAEDQLVVLEPINM